MRKPAKKHRGVFEKIPGSGIWWVCYHDARGRRRREKVGRKGDAITLYGKRKTEVLQRKKLPENFRALPVLFAVLAEDALEYSKANKLSYKTDEWRMGLLKKAFGDRQADSITPQEIERWIAEHEDWKPATVNRYRALVSLAYRLGAKNGKVDVNPARMVRHRKENNGRVRFLSKEEEKVLREKIEAEAAEHLPEFQLALNTGLRRSEQYRLTWDCVNFEKRVLTVPQSKNGEPRHVQLNSAALSALAALRSRREAGGRVFRQSARGTAVGASALVRARSPGRWAGRFYLALPPAHLCQPPCHEGGGPQDGARAHGAQEYPDDVPVRSPGPVPQAGGS